MSDTLDDVRVSDTLVERINETESIEHQCSSKLLGPFRRNGPLEISSIYATRPSAMKARQPPILIEPLEGGKILIS